MSSKTSLSMDVQELILGITYKDGETVDKKKWDKNRSDEIEMVNI